MVHHRRTGQCSPAPCYIRAYYTTRRRPSERQEFQRKKPVSTKGGNMKGKRIVGILIAACFGAVIATAHGDVPSRITTTPPIIVAGPTIIVAGCRTTNIGMWVVPLGGAGVNCPNNGVPLHGVPMPYRGRMRNLRLTGDYAENALEGSVITVYVNGSPTALSCTVDTSGTCQDNAHTVGVRPGDELGATFTVNTQKGTGMTMSLAVCFVNGGYDCTAG